MASLVRHPLSADTHIVRQPAPPDPRPGPPRSDPGYSFPGVPPRSRVLSPHRRDITRLSLELELPRCGGALRETRERRQVTEGGFRTRNEALGARSDKLRALREGSFVSPTHMTLAEYLRDKWLPAVRGEGLKATALDSYEDHVKHHLIGPAKAPYLLGATPLQKVTREAIRAHYGQLAKKGRVDGGGGLSAASIRRVHATLHRALNDAVESGWLARNPAQGVAKRLPRPEGDAQPALKARTSEQLNDFLKAAEHDRLFPLWRLYAMTGMRRGEALALRWDDLDLEQGTVAITKSRTPVGGRVVESTPKSKRSRVVHLDADTVDVLQAHAAAQLEEIAAAGEGWHDERYVFTKQDGRPLEPNWVYREFRAAAQKAALPHIPLRGLRHTHATAAFHAGVNPKIVQERLGHGDVGITLNIYSHAIAQQDAEAAAIIANRVSSATRSE